MGEVVGLKRSSLAYQVHLEAITLGHKEITCIVKINLPQVNEFIVGSQKCWLDRLLHTRWENVNGSECIKRAGYSTKQ